MATVSITESGPIAGVWAECDAGVVGLVAADKGSAYLVLYGKEDGRVRGGLPALAIGVHGGEAAEIQLPGADGHRFEAHAVSLEQVFEAVRALKAPPKDA